MNRPNCLALAHFLRTDPLVQEHFDMEVFFGTKVADDSYSKGHRYDA